ncbi:MAG TPA: 3-dehydroquinate synthase [Candidatus Limnocylindria bacterium]|nr:3-dehydroquinate synthase [Candidatus Limnocylindria bacterium]
MSARVEEVTVDLGRRSYQVLVGGALLRFVGPRLAALGFRGRCALVTSERIGALHGTAVEHSLRAAGFEPCTVALPDGEEHKTLATVERIYDALLEAGIERRSPVVALGGGVVGDVTGFAAATLLRGVPVMQVPTTLLAQVDAAIGGKTGVNHRLGKNLIGAFHQPCAVLADTDVLRTLPRREYIAGLAEVVKYGVIGDAELFAVLERDLEALLHLDADTLVRVVAACVRQKAAVVAADEREESGARATLNFGHTVGHGVEVLTDYRRFLHGEAVAIGMVAACRVSETLGIAPAGLAGRVQAVLERAGLPTALPSELRGPQLAVAMRTDKKAAGGKIRFVAVEDVGRTRLVELASSEIVKLL